jgi:phage-related protein
MPSSGSLGPRRRWRDYRTASGRRPVKEALDELSDMDLASVVLFAPQGGNKQILLSLEAFKKKTQRTPKEKIRLARRRLSDWERRGEK